MVEFEVREPLSRLDLSLALVNRRGVQVLDESFSDTGNLCIAGRPGVHRARLLIPPVLANDDYSLKLWMERSTTTSSWSHSAFASGLTLRTPVTGRREPASFSPWLSGASIHDEPGVRAAGRYQYRSASGRSEARSTREPPTARWST